MRGAAGPPLTRPRPSLRTGHGEPRRQLAAAPGDGGLPLVEEVRRLRGEDRRPLPALRHGQLLAQPLPQVLLLPGPARGHRHLLLHQERHDPLQERLHQVRHDGRAGRESFHPSSLPFFSPSISRGGCLRGGGVGWFGITP